MGFDEVDTNTPEQASYPRASCGVRRGRFPLKNRSPAACGPRCSARGRPRWARPPPARRGSWLEPVRRAQRGPHPEGGWVGSFEEPGGAYSGAASSKREAYRLARREWVRRLLG